MRHIGVVDKKFRAQWYFWKGGVNFRMHTLLAAAQRDTDVVCILVKGMPVHFPEGDYPPLPRLLEDSLRVKHTGPAKSVRCNALKEVVAAVGVWRAASAAGRAAATTRVRAAVRALFAACEQALPAGYAAA